MTSLHPAIAALVARHGAAADDPRVAELVAELSQQYAAVDDERRALAESLGRATSELAERYDLLARQTRALQRLNELLAEGGELAALFPRMCAELCAALDVARVSVWLVDDTGAAMDCVLRYEHATGASLPTPAIAMADVPTYAAALMHQRTLAVVDVMSDPNTVEIAERARAHRVRALLDSACRSGGRVIGMICHEHLDTPRSWTPEEISFAGSVADGVALAIERQRRDRAERDRAALEDNLRHAQKMESLGHLAGGVAHDLNNMLTPILICGELVREAVAHDAELAESMDAIVAAGTSARDLVSSLLSFGRKQHLRLTPLDPNAVCERALKLVQHSLPPSITVRLVRGATVPTVAGDSMHLQQVLVNLVINARDAMPEGGTVTVTTEAEADGGGVIIRVEDSGVGIDPALLPHLFEPFFSTRHDGRGGLGLAMVYGILRQHGGSVEATTAAGRGTRFELRLPAMRDAVPAPPRLRRDSVPGLAPSTILVVEDDPQVLGLVTNVLRREGFNVIDASSPTTAIDLAGMHPGHLDLVLTDVVMPHMNGVQMFARIAERRPDVRVVYMSGYGKDALSQAGDAQLLHKPFSANGLVAAVRSALVTTPIEV